MGKQLIHYSRHRPTTSVTTELQARQPITNGQWASTTRLLVISSKTKPCQFSYLALYARLSTILCHVGLAGQEVLLSKLQRQQRRFGGIEMLVVLVKWTCKWIDDDSLQRQVDRRQRWCWMMPAIYAAKAPYHSMIDSDVIIYQGLCVQGQGHGVQGQCQRLTRKMRPGPRTRTWSQGRGLGEPGIMAKKLQAETKEIQKLLPQ